MSWNTSQISRMSLFLALMILGAKIQIPLPTPLFTMHITLQLLISVLCGFFFPPKQVGWILASYILFGLAGLPVFASGGGIGYLLRPTFGYVLGFLFCALWIARSCQKKKPSTNKDFFLLALKGMSLYYVSGLIYYYFGFRLFLSSPIPLSLTLFNGFVVSIVPDTLITFAACLIAKRLYPIYFSTRSFH